MDCEKFDTHILDELYDELDEVMSAAMKRHAEGCDRCGELEKGLRATMTMGVLPLEEPHPDLEERILAAALEAERSESWLRKVLRSLSWAGSYAMRPQFAMAALLVVVLGSSVLLLRARPGSVATVTPEEPRDATASPVAQLVPLDQAPAGSATLAPLAKRYADEPSKQGAIDPLAAGSSSDGAKNETLTDEALDSTYNKALASYKAGRFADAQLGFNTVNNSGSPHAANAALYEARSVRAGSGCGAAVKLFGTVQHRFNASAAAADAAWEEADCHQKLGQTEQAVKLWSALAKNDQYRSRAVNALNARGQVGSAGKAARRAAPPPAKSAPPGGGSAGKAAATAEKPTVGFHATDQSL